VKESLEGVANHGQALAIVRQHFFGVKSAEDMGQFAEACTCLVDRLRNPIAVPAVFGYAARARLHDITAWEARENRQFSPTPRLLASLAGLLEMPAAIECRRNYYWGLVDGLTRYVAGDIDGAWTRFALTAQCGEIGHVFHNDDMAGAVPLARCLPGVLALETPRCRRFTRSAAMIRPPARGRRLTCMVSVDPIYAAAFAPVWIETLSRHAGSDLGFHIHVMTNGAPDDAAMGDLLALASDSAVDVSVSIDDTVQPDRAYFTCSRFLCAADIMRAVGSPLLLCDADLAVSRPDELAGAAVSALTAERGCRAIINTEPGHGYLPWRHVSASLVYLGNDELARSFIETVGCFIEYYWDDQLKTNWWIDQLALESARLFLLRGSIEADACRRIDERIRRVFVTPPNHKSTRLALVPQVRALLGTGNNLHRALDLLSSQPKT
jgi:hypothetical protein